MSWLSHCHDAYIQMYQPQRNSLNRNSADILIRVSVPKYCWIIFLLCLITQRWTDMYQQIYKLSNRQQNTTIWLQINAWNFWRLTISPRVWDLLQINEMCGKGNISNVCIIHYLDFDFSNKRRKHLNEADLFIPYWFCTVAFNRCFSLYQKKKWLIQVSGLRLIWNW